MSGKYGKKSDEYLIAKYLRGDANALRELWKRYEPTLKHFVDELDEHQQMYRLSRLFSEGESRPTIDRGELPWYIWNRIAKAVPLIDLREKTFQSWFNELLQKIVPPVPQEARFGVISATGDRWVDLASSIVPNFAGAENTFEVRFDPELSSEQIHGALNALANYYRACGGLGLEIEPDSVLEVGTRESVFA